MMEGTSYHPTPAGDLPPSVAHPSSFGAQVIPASQSPSSKLLAELNKLSAGSQSLEQLVRGCKDVVDHFSDVIGLWLCKRGTSLFDETFSLMEQGQANLWEAYAVPAKKLMKLTLQHRQIQSIQIGQDLLMSAPVIDGEQINAILIGSFRSGKRPISEIEFMLGAVCQTVASWLVTQRCIGAEVRSRSLNDVVVLGRALDRCSNLNSAAIILVNQLKKMTGAGQVVFAAESRTSLPEVLAISDIDEIDAGFDGLALIRLACAQALQTHEIVVYPDRRNGNDSQVQALGQYCRKLGHEACICLPLKKSPAEALGCVLITTTAAQLAQSSYISYLSEVGELLSGHLNVVMQANRGLVDHAITSLNTRLTSSRSKVVTAALLTIVAIMLIPWPYRVHCDCEMQPVSRRFVAAPHDGILEKNLVQIGDLVSRGQRLAVLDDRQLRIELAGLEAELKGTSKRRSAATAQGSIAEAQIAAAEAKKLKADIELVNSKLQNLDISSPISGIVVAGDLDKAEGAPVEMGQTLFEIGPLDNMLVEIAVPEDEISYVSPGMSISLKLNAYPFETWSGNVTRIHPKAEIRNDQTVFIAEVELPNEARKLKPGMKGNAKIQSAAYPIGWNLFHRPFEKLRRWTIW